MARNNIRKTLHFFSSHISTALLILAVVLAMITATILEKQYSASDAYTFVYGAPWFEGLIVLLFLNLIIKLFFNKLNKTRTLPAIFITISLLLIISGAFITRYNSINGVIHLEKNKKKAEALSKHNYLLVNNKTTESPDYLEKVFFSPINNTLTQKLDISGKTIQVSVKDYMENAIKHIVQDESGAPVVKLTVFTEGGLKEVLIKSGSYKEVAGTRITFNKNMPGAYRLMYNSGRIFFSPPEKVNVEHVTDKLDTTLSADGKYVLKKTQRISGKNITFTMEKLWDRAKTVYVNQPDMSQIQGETVIKLSLQSGSKQQKVYLNKSILKKPERVKINGVTLQVGYGKKPLKLPFSVTLDELMHKNTSRDFGSPDYTSIITLSYANGTVHYRLSSNKQISFKGYRLYQNSQETKKGTTRLTIKKDFYGRWTIFSGYILFVAGMLFSLLNPGSKFRNLMRRGIQSPGLKRKTSFILLILICLPVIGYNQTPLKNIPDIDKKHAKKFGRLLIKKNKNDIKPVSTYAENIIENIYGDSRFQGKLPEQVMLEMIVFPKQYKKVNLIKLPHANLKKIIRTDTNYLAFNDFFSEGKKSFLLQKEVNMAYIKAPSLRSSLDKALIQTDQKINTCYNIFSGQHFRIFPDTINDKSWYYPNLQVTNYSVAKSSIERTFNTYLNTLKDASKNNTYVKANQLLEKISQKQRKLSKQELPSELQIKAEQVFSNIQIFTYLKHLYLYLGLILLIIPVILYIKQFKILLKTHRIIFKVLVILFFIHLAGIAFQWYISGHGPWNGSYETMIFFAGAALLAGIFFSKKSQITLALGVILAATGLFVSDISWLQAGIFTGVLKTNSLWMTFSASLITTAYGFLGVAALTGILNLTCIIFRNPTNKGMLGTNIENITTITKIAMNTGVYILITGVILFSLHLFVTTGNYWHWASYNTWLLITILMYGMVYTILSIPGFKQAYYINVLSVVAYVSVLMNLVGCNLFINNVHGYSAENLPVAVTDYIFYSMAFIAFIALLAYTNEYRRQNYEHKHLNQKN